MFFDDAKSSLFEMETFFVCPFCNETIYYKPFALNRNPKYITLVLSDKPEVTCKREICQKCAEKYGNNVKVIFSPKKK